MPTERNLAQYQTYQTNRLIHRTFASGGSTIFGAGQHVLAVDSGSEPPSRLQISDEHKQDEKQEDHMAQLVQHVVLDAGVEDPRLKNSVF
jgi:hypothetical protein